MVTLRSTPGDFYLIYMYTTAEFENTQKCIKLFEDWEREQSSLFPTEIHDDFSLCVMLVTFLPACPNLRLVHDTTLWCLDA